MPYRTDHADLARRPLRHGAKESDVPEILDRIEAGAWDALAAAFPLLEEDSNIED